MRATAVTAVLAAASIARAADDAPQPSPTPPAPERREILVPAKDLAAVLAQNPRAVALTREQYETLLRDALKQLKPAPEPPRRAVLTSARYNAELRGNVVEVHADFTVNVLSEHWAEVPLRLSSLKLGEIKVDSETALRASAGTAGKARDDIETLIIRGRGEHKLSAQFTLPIQREPGLSAISLGLPAAATSAFTIKLPPQTHVESPLPVKIENTPDATLATVALAATTDLSLSWRAESDSAGNTPVIFEADSFLYVIDELKVQADLGIVLNASLGDLPASIQIALPADATPLQVQGSEVLKWNASGSAVTVELTPDQRKTVALRVLVETRVKWEGPQRPDGGGKAAGGGLPLLRGAEAAPTLALASRRATLSLPTPIVAGVHRAVGKLAVIGSREIKVRTIAADALARQTEGAFAPLIETDPNFVAAYQFPARTNPPAVAVEKIPPRFSADLDTLIDIQREAVFIERTVALTPDEGELFNADIDLPPGEELLSVREGDTEPDWTRDGAKLRIRWPDAVAVGGRKTFAIKTRIDPADWATLTQLALTIGDAKVERAEKTNGYIAARAEQMFRIETQTANLLERRDGRTTPVRGDFAWFRRNEFKLVLNVTRRTPEVRAALVGYALPLQGALSVRAEIDYDIDYSGVRIFRVKVPKQYAEQFYFDGDQIAERKLDGDTWTITLQKETLGRYALKVSAVIPFATTQRAEPPAAVPAPASGAKQAADGKKASAKTHSGGETHFDTEVPAIEPLDVKRDRGTWVVEANTDTEINFNAAGMNEIDLLNAPALPDYQPEHRIIGAFEYLGGQAHALKLTGARHASAKLLTTVVDQLQLTSVVSPTGVDRHEAIFDVRSAGDQFFDIKLPQGASLLSLAVDGSAVKPVGETASVVRVQLGAKPDRASATRIQVIYETSKRDWGAAGKFSLLSPRVTSRIPIIRTTWRAYLPEGFSYSEFATELQQRDAEPERVLIAKPFLFAGRALGSIFKRGYFSKATIEMRPENYRAMEAFGGNISGSIVDSRFAETQFQVMQKKEILYPVIERLKLDEKWAAPGQKLSKEETYQQLVKKLDFGAVKNTNLIDIGVHDVDPQEAADIANTLASVYIEKRREVQEQLISQALAQLEESVNEQRKAVETAAKRAAEIRQRLSIVDPDPEKASAADGTNADYGRAKNDYIAAKRLLESAEANINAEAMKIQVQITPAQIQQRAEPATSRKKSEISDFFEMKAESLAEQVAKGVKAPAAPAGKPATAAPEPARRMAELPNAVDALVVAGQAGAPEFGFKGKMAGLLPVQFDLPLTGKRYDFGGFYGPGKLRFKVQFHYLNWWSESRRAWVWFVVEGIGFLFLARNRPWFRMLLGVLVLTFVPLAVTPAATGFCNALLAGWLVAFALNRIAKRFVFRARVVEAIPARV
jgi:hypothetical protein